MQTDRIFSQHTPQTGEFTFDENVANVFDDMINRSVPLYSDVQRAIPALVQMLDHRPIRIVDLGCSTGTSLIHLAMALPKRSLELVGVDNSQSMLDKFREKQAALNLTVSTKLFCQNIQDFEFEKASVILMNYTLQFIALQQRQSMLKRLRNSLRTDGFLLISEKVIHADTAMDRHLTELYFDFKRRNGYSELEIARKRDALENVLVPQSIEQNLSMLNSAGFSRCEILLKWFNFATIIARP